MRTMGITDFCEIAEEIKSLNDKLSHLGLEIILGEKKVQAEHAVPQLKRVRRGIGKYWDAINEIAASRGITKAEAREIHKKATEKANGKPNAKIAESLTKYWNAVKAVRAEKNLTVTEAREIVKKSKAVVTEAR